MRLRLTMLPRLVAKLVRHGRVSMQALSACAFVTLWASTANAQLDGNAYATGGAVGTAAIGQSMNFSDASQAPPNIFVGPGGETSVTNVPSAFDPNASGQRTKFVTQGWPQGGAVQAPAAYQDSGIPCPCDQGCDFTYYASAEALYFRREYDERFTLSQFRIPPFDYEWAGRVTVGTIWDCVNGYEFVYAGPFKWSRDMSATSAGGNLLSRLTTAGGYVPGNISAFNNANIHTQTYQARLNSYEFNRRWWAWDIFSVLVGMRAVDYREYYGFFSQSAAGVGIYEDHVRNRLFGPQIGGEINQPFGLRTLVGFRGKGALLANFARNATNMQNAGLLLIDSVDSNVDVAGLFELGSYVKYSITPSIRLQAGYDLWYLPSVATVASQGLNVVSPGTAQKVNTDDDLFLHGASFGAQILY